MRVVTLDNGFAIRARRGRVKIYPTRYGSDLVTIGVGNAKITINRNTLKQKGTVFMREIISGDADGTYIPPLYYGYSRGVKNYESSSYEDLNINGKVVRVKRLNGFTDTSNSQEKSCKVLLTADVRNDEVGSGRILEW